MIDAWHLFAFTLLLQGCVVHQLSVFPKNVNGVVFASSGYVGNDARLTTGVGPIHEIGVIPGESRKVEAGWRLLYFKTEKSGIFRSIEYFSDDSSTITFNTAKAYRLATKEEQWFKLAVVGQVQVGMREDFVYLALGKACSIDTIVGSQRIRKQLTFVIQQPGLFAPALHNYVDIEDGYVTSWKKDTDK